MVARFDARNPRAETWLRETSSRLITDIVNEQRAQIRGVLTQNMAEGVSPRRAALDVVGRINRLTGRREGGIIGLTKGDMATVDRALAELRSGDPRQLENYLRRKGRDRRFDSTVRRALREGTPVSSEQASKMVGRYSDTLLRKRGETIARTELLQSLHAAQDEGLQQLLDGGQLQRSQITATWDAAQDGDTRPTHADAHGSVADAQGFFTVGGYLMRHPGDRSQGAPAREIINCRCRKRISIDFIAGLRRGD